MKYIPGKVWEITLFAIIEANREFFSPIVSMIAYVRKFPKEIRIISRVIFLNIVWSFLLIAVILVYDIEYKSYYIYSICGLFAIELIAVLGRFYGTINLLAKIMNTIIKTVHNKR